MGTRAECAYENSHYDAAAGNAEVYGCAHSGQMDRNHAERQTEYHSEEYRSEVWLVEHLDGVAEELFGVAYVFRCADNGETVAVLQAQIVACKQFYVAAHYAADVHSVGCAHVEGSECFAVEAGACEQYDATFHVTVYCVPVYTILVAVPVLLHLLAEEYVHGVRLIDVCHNEHVVALLHSCICQRHYHLTVAPDTRYDEVAVGHLRYLVDGFAVECRVYHDVLRNVCVVFIVLVAWFEVGRFDEETAYEYHGKYHSDNSERIGNGASQCCSAAGKSGAGECLLCRGKGGSIGCGAAEDAGHVCNAYACQRTEKKCQCSTGDNDGETPHVERHAFVAHHAHKAWSYVQTEGVDEKQQAECLCKFDHLGVGAEAELTSDNAYEEHKSYSERDAAYMELAKCKSGSSYQRKHNGCLCGRVYAEKPVYPIHSIMLLFDMQRYCKRVKGKLAFDFPSAVISYVMILHTGGKKVCFQFSECIYILCKDSSSCRYCKEKSANCLYNHVLCIFTRRIRVHKYHVRGA